MYYVDVGRVHSLHSIRREKKCMYPISNCLRSFHLTLIVTLSVSTKVLKHRDSICAINVTNKSWMQSTTGKKSLKFRLKRHDKSQANMPQVATEAFPRDSKTGVMTKASRKYRANCKTLEYSNENLWLFPLLLLFGCQYAELTFYANHFAHNSNISIFNEMLWIWKKFFAWNPAFFCSLNDHIIFMAITTEGHRGWTLHKLIIESITVY